MSARYVTVNFSGREVADDSPYAYGKKAVEIMCDGCGHTGKESDDSTWDCPCRCHDGWKMGNDGGRYRDQLERGLAGRGVDSGGEDRV